MSKVRMYAGAVALCLLAAMPLVAQAPSMADMYAKIKAEETNNSKAMWIIHEIADVHGPRVTGTPGLKAADDWAVATMKSWGLQNVHLEPWTFQPPSAATPAPGWDNLLLQADAVTPFHGQVIVKPLAWTPGTPGVVTSSVVILLPPGLGGVGGPAAGRGGRGGRGGADAPPPPGCEETDWAAPPKPAAPEPIPGVMPTKEELDAYLNSMKSKVAGHIVMVGKHVEVAENCYPAPLRRTEQSWKDTYDPNNPNAGRGRGGAGGGAGRGAAAPSDGKLTVQEVARAVDNFLVDNHAAVRINDAGRAYGLIVAQQANYYDITRVVPTLVMRNEDYGRIYRIMMEDKLPVTLKINIQNKIYPEGKTSYNAIGEIPGTDKADEVVMLGGHYDSWHDATGATDNGIGSTMMLEAIRILQALGVKPRRTIRVALWSGEEEGLLGSLNYVEQHFGTAENPKPEFAKLDCYFNIDSGTGKPRGAGIFGPPAAADMLRPMMMPFADWGFSGVSAPTRGNPDFPDTRRQTGGTDSTSFNHAGLPGIGLNQDGFDYNSFTHHTNYDTYERIYENDVREGAVEIAAAVYAMAMADEMVPRFPPAQMPAPVCEDAAGSRAVPLKGPIPPPCAAAGRGGAN
ncbi:MAG TPA: M20/M25/M40 family metallo-hydrolase [Candidatus Acidoferrales bacterium]